MNTNFESFHPDRSLWTRRNFFLVAVTLAMGTLGVWSEVKAGNAKGKKILTRTLQVSVHPDGQNGASAEMTLSQWPNGDVWIQGSAWKGDTVLTANDWKTATGEINVGAGVATAQGRAAGTLWDFGANNGPSYTPASVDVAMEVVDTSTVWALRGEYAQSGLVIKDTWDKPTAKIARLDVAGHEDVTLNGGAMLLKVDDTSFLTGNQGLGHLKQNTSHTVDVLK